LEEDYAQHMDEDYMEEEESDCDED